MSLTQGQFSFLPDLTDEQIEAQINYALGNDWAIMVEYTDDPHPRNTYWDMWSPPMFDLDESEADVAMRDVNACREALPHLYMKVVAYDRSLGRQTPALSFIVNRPEDEPGFRLERQESHDRMIRYTIHSYAGSTRRRASAMAARAGSWRRSSASPRARRTASRQTDGTDARNPAREALPGRGRRRRRRGRAGGARPRPGRPRARQEAHPRDRGAPGDRQAASRGRARVVTPVAAHELHRQPRHRQDDRRAADGGDPPSARLHRQAERGLRHARRPRRPVRRPHRAQDARRAQARDGRRALHRRGVLPLPARERARLRAGGDRDPPAGHGDRARGPRRHPRRLQGPHGDVLPVQPRHGLARRPPSALPGLHARGAAADRRAHDGAAAVRVRATRRARPSRSTSSGAWSARASPTAAASATRSIARACARPTGCTPTATTWPRRTS